MWKPYLEKKFTTTKWIVKSILWLSSVVGLCPVRWDKENQRCRVLGHFHVGRFGIRQLNLYIIWFIFYSAFILIRIGTFAFIVISYSRTNEIIPFENIITFFYLCVTLMETLYTTYCLFLVKPAVAHTNQLIQFNTDASALHKHNKTDLLCHLFPVSVGFSLVILANLTGIPTTAINAY